MDGTDSEEKFIICLLCLYFFFSLSFFYFSHHYNVSNLPTVPKRKLLLKDRNPRQTLALTSNCILIVIKRVITGKKLLSPLLQALIIHNHGSDYIHTVFHYFLLVCHFSLKQQNVLNVLCVTLLCSVRELCDPSGLPVCVCVCVLW